MNNGLKPCPCCGGEATDDSDEGVHGKFFQVFCRFCGLTMCGYTIEAARDKWNRRADAPRKTSERPPTEEDGVKDYAGRPCVLAWFTNYKMWMSKPAKNVVNWPEEYPYWMPVPPNPEEEISND